MGQVAFDRKDSVARERIFRGLEPLEARLLLAFSAHINFQPPGVATPAGYIADLGAAYSSQHGLTYGWNTPNNNARDRNLNSNQLYDTFAPMQASGKPFTWQIGAP